MTEAQAIEAIYQRWRTIWLAAHPLVPFHFENEGAESAGSWARVSVRHTTSRQMTQGQAPYRKFERRGVIMVQLWSPIDAGRAAMSALCDSARTVFEGKTIDEGLNCYGGATQESQTDGAWFMASVVTQFRYVETR